MGLGRAGGRMQEASGADWQRTWHAVRDVLGSKWAFHVVRALIGGDAGFNELQRRLDGVTAKVLSERLRELRCLGFVTREVHATSPPTTTYSLTEPGEELASILGDVESLVDVVECPDGDCPVPVDGTDCDQVEPGAPACDC